MAASAHSVAEGAYWISPGAHEPLNSGTSCPAITNSYLPIASATITTSRIAQVLKTHKSFRLKEEAGTRPNVHYIGKYSARG